VAKDTIEEKIVDLHHHKRDLADSLLEGTDASGKLSLGRIKDDSRGEMFKKFSARIRFSFLSN
ncbi:MAG: hypothetical protein ACKPGB_09100, partial [Dolichospermum sp.]